MKTVTGDLVKLALAGEYDLVMQGCNCLNQMGKGLALQLKKTWKEVYKADLATTAGDWNKLGTYSKAVVDVNGKPLTVLNCYTQYTYNSRTEDVLVNYAAVQRVLNQVKQEYSGMKMAMPLLGCGLAGGDWNVVSQLVENTLAGEDLTLVLLPK